jgi:PKHD-type hydroxylase
MNLLRTNKKIHPIYWIDNFLSEEEIQKLIEYTKSLPLEHGKLIKPIEEKKPFSPTYHIKNPNVDNVPRIRITNIKWILLDKKTDWLYKKIINQIHKVNQENFDMILKFVENLQFSEYTENQQGFYSKHNDCGRNGEIENYFDVRKLSFSIQLTSENEYEGGELVFYLNNQEKIAPKTKGTIIFFESNIIHEVKPVKKGVRHALVGWVQGPNLR